MSVRLSHAEAGAGPPVVLLHPIGLDRTCWQAVTCELAQRYRIVAVDLRGHGSSPDAGADLAVEHYADDVAQLIAGLQCGPAAIVGVSFGGMVAQAVALRYPDLVAALVAAACPATLPDEGRAAMQERGARALAGGMAAVVDETITRWFTDGFRNAPEVAAVRLRLLADRPANWAAAWNAIARVDLLPWLSSIRAPTLALAAEQDRAIPVAAVQAIAGAIPGAALQVVPQAPHMLQIEQSGAFAAAVDGFLSALARPAS